MSHEFLPLQKDKIEMRKVYAQAMREQFMENTPVIALEADLMSSMAMDAVHRDFPQQVINCGIMEANVIGTAAGFHWLAEFLLCIPLLLLLVAVVLISFSCLLITRKTTSR